MSLEQIEERILYVEMSPSFNWKFAFLVNNLKEIVNNIHKGIL